MTVPGGLYSGLLISTAANSVTMGNQSGNAGYVGPGDVLTPQVGSIVPTSGQINGVSITALIEVSGFNIFVRLAGSGRAQTFFTSITINGITYTTASASSFGNNGATTQWSWNSPLPGLVIGNTYPWSYT